MLVQKFKYFSSIVKKVLGISPKNPKNSSCLKLDDKTIDEINADSQHYYNKRKKVLRKQ